MITTLLLQTIMAAATSRPITRNSNTEGMTFTPSTLLTTTAAALNPESGNNDGAVKISLEDLQNTAAAAAKKSAQEFKESLKRQSWGDILFGSPRRIAATVANGALLGYPVISSIIQFGFIESSSSPLSLNNITLSNAQNRFAGLSDAGKGIAISAVVTGITGLITSATQYCLTKEQFLEPQPGATESEPTTTTVDFFDNVKQVVVGQGEDEVIMILAAFKKRTDFDAKNPYKKNAYAVVLNDGTTVQISEEGLRMDQGPSAEATK